MKTFFHRSILVVAAVLILAVPAPSPASTMTFTMTGDDLANAISTTPEEWDPGLDHNAYYIWAIPSGFTGGNILGATITFENLRNWQDEPNWLAAYLIDTPTPGITNHFIYDKDSATSVFAGMVPQSGYAYVDTLVNVPVTGTNYTLDLFSLGSGRSVESTLETFAADGFFGIGLDPHCHYWFDRITVTVVPEPASILFLGAGLVALASWGMRKSSR